MLTNSFFLPSTRHQIDLGVYSTGYLTMAQVSCSSGTLSIVQDSTRERSTTHTLHLSAHEPDHEPYIDEVQTLVAKFLNEINYQRPSNIQNDVLYNAMLKRARATGVELSSPMSRRCFDVGHTYAAVSQENRFTSSQNFYIHATMHN